MRVRMCDSFKFKLHTHTHTQNSHTHIENSSKKEPPLLTQWRIKLKAAVESDRAIEREKEGTSSSEGS